MLSHYLNTAVRHFRQHKLTTGINVMCLALGLMCFMLAWGTVTWFEQRDRYHARADRTYFVSWNAAADRNAPPDMTGPFLLAPALSARFPQLEAVARLVGESMGVTHEDRSYWAAISFADPEFLDIFDIPLIGTRGSQALRQPRSAVVSRALAMRMFGTENVIGRTLRLGDRENVTITGLIGDIPQPSSFATEWSPRTITLEVVASMDTRTAMLASRIAPPGDTPRGGWYPDGTATFVVLPANGSLQLRDLNAQLVRFAEEDVPRGPRRQPAIEAHPISEVMHLDTARMVGALSGTTVLQILGALILFVAAVNYANLATALAGQRMRDVALRKVVGASQRAVMGQYLFEAFLLTSTALVLALIAAGVLVTVTDIASFKGLAALFFGIPEFWWVIAAVILAVTLVSGTYPAFVLANVRPIRVLRGAAERSARAWVATGLLGLQFAFASLAIIAVLVMVRQDQQLKQALWKPDSDPVVMLLSGASRVALDRSVLRAELSRVPGVVGVTGAVQALWDRQIFPLSLARSDDPQANRVVTAINVVDFDFFQTLGIRLLAGRDFDRAHGNDITDLRPGAAPATDRNVVVDRRLALRLGFPNPNDAVGQVIYRTAKQVVTTSSSATATRYHIVGLVEDTALNPMPDGQEGNVFLVDPYTSALPIVRVSRHNVAATLDGIQETWKRLAPRQPLATTFIDEYYERSFSQLREVERILTFLSGFALFICVMGLIGMALHVIRRRTHEIGVRKTLGASASQILMLLLRTFSKPIVIANFAVWPIAYYGARLYTSQFVQSTVGSPFEPIALSLVIALAVAWLAVGGQAFRAARVKPAEVLRYE